MPARNFTKKEQILFYINIGVICFAFAYAYFYGGGVYFDSYLLSLGYHEYYNS